MHFSHSLTDTCDTLGLSVRFLMDLKINYFNGYDFMVHIWWFFVCLFYLVCFVLVSDMELSLIDTQC